MYEPEEGSSDNSPSIILNNPEDNYYNDTSSPVNVTFNCSATDDIQLANISLYITNSSNESFSLNQTTNITGLSNSTTWTLSLGNGNYTWNCLGYDNSSQEDWANTNRSLTINYTGPTNPPNVTIESPTNGDKYKSNTSIIFTANITDDYNAISEVLFSVNFPNTTSINYTPQHPTTKTIDGTFTDWNNLDSIGTDPDESNATIPNEFDLKEAFISHNNTDILIRFDIYGSNANGIDTGTYFYDFLIDDDMNPNTGYNQSAIQGGYNFLFENGNLYNYSGTGGGWGWTSAGAVSYAISSDNSSMEISVKKSRINSSDTSNLKIFFSLSNGANTDYFPDSTPFIYNFTKYLYEFNNTENIGNYNLTIYTNDTGGELNNTEKVYFDIIQLYTNITSPQNTTYTNATILVNITSDGVSTWYNWNGTNITYATPINVTFTTGSNTLYAYNNDSSGNLNYTSVTFNVSEIVPINVTNIYPTQGRNYSLEEIVKIQSDITGGTIDTALAKLTYPNSSSINLTMKKTTPKIIDGNISDWINTESIGTDQDEVLIDSNNTYDLKEAFISNNATSLFLRSDYYGDINISYPAFYDILLDIDLNSSTGWDKNNLWNYGYEYLVENGNIYSYNESAGGWNWSLISSVNYAISADLRSMEVEVPKSLINNTNITNILFAAGPGNITTSDFILNGPDTRTFLFRFYNENTYKTIFSNTAETGRYNITIFTNTTTGITNNTESTWFNVVGDITPPGITLISPYDTQIFNISNVTFNCDVTDDIELKNSTLYTNISGTWQPYSTVNVSGEENSSSWNITNIPSGSYEWNCLAYDESNNSKMYEDNWTFTVSAEDTTPPNCTLVSITPLDLEANSTGKFEFLINCTDEDGINISRFLITKTLEGLASPGIPNLWSIRPPINDKAQNATCPCTSAVIPQILRADGRTDGKWYDFAGITNLSSNAGGDNFTYAVNDYSSIRINITNGSNWALLNYSFKVEPSVFRNMVFLSRGAMESEFKQDYYVWKNNGLLVKFWNLEAMRNSSNYTVTAFGNFNYSGNPNKEMRLYYCNSSYNMSLGIPPNNDLDNCVFLQSLDQTELDSPRVYSSRNSSYRSDIFAITNGKIGGITATEENYIYYSSLQTGGTYFLIRYANETSGTNVSFKDSQVAWYTTNGGVSFIQAEFTPDIWIAKSITGDQFQLGVYAEDLLGNNLTNLTFYTDDIGDVNYPISGPNIEAYIQGILIEHNASLEDRNLNGSYHDNMTVHINIAIDPDSVGSVNHSLYLYNTDGTLNYTINNSFYSLDDSDVHVFFDTNLVSDGKYKMNVTARASDNPQDIKSHLTYDNFTIDNALPPSVTNILPTPGTIYNVSNPINISATITNGGASINYTYINITFPNGTIQQLSLINTIGDTYSIEFSDIIQKGVYNISFFANDSLGNENKTETTWFNRTHPL